MTIPPLAILALFGCDAPSAPPLASPEVPVVRPSAPPPPFPAGTRSLRLKKTTPVRLLPEEAAKRIGTIVVDTRVRWREVKAAGGCVQPWVRIVPDGWICGDLLEPVQLPAAGGEIPRLDRDELVPGIYGKVVADGISLYTWKKPQRTSPSTPTAPTSATMQPTKPVMGSLTVRKYDEVTVNGRVFWKVSRGNDYLPKAVIRQHVPSTYGGTRLADDTGLELPLAFVWPRGTSPYAMAWTHGKPIGGGVKRQLPRREVVAVLDTALDAVGKPAAYRIGVDEWIDAAVVRVFPVAPPPAGLLPGERWLDVHLDTQILVAFEGEVAVYATLISSGAKNTPTETGVFRMWKKMSEADMNGLTGEDPYSVATVPWTQYFSPDNGLALHTSYWHDDFGITKSHGCINLAPRDARWLYFWSAPDVAPGWTMAAGVVEAPGSIVRVRTDAEPNPPLKGYAKKVQELRSGAAG